MNLRNEMLFTFNPISKQNDHSIDSQAVVYLILEINQNINKLSHYFCHP